MKKLYIAIMCVLVMFGSLVWAVNLEMVAQHTIAQADSVTAGAMRYFKDTTISTIIDIRDFNRLWFQFQKHAPDASAGTDTAFSVDSVEVYVQTSMDGSNWTTTALCNAPRVPIFATADSVFNITTANAKAFKRDSTIIACGPLLRAMVVVSDTAAWVGEILGNTYAWRFQLHVEGIKP